MQKNHSEHLTMFACWPVLISICRSACPYTGRAGSL